MNVCVLLNFLTCVVIEMIAHQQKGVAGCWFPKFRAMFRKQAPLNKQAKTAVDLTHLAGGVEPYISTNGELSAVGLPKWFASSDSDSSSPPRSRSNPDSEANALRKASDCWHKCIRTHGYIEDDDGEYIPLTDGKMVKAPGRNFPECVCKLSSDVSQLLNSKGLSVENFESKRLNDKSGFENLLKINNIKYLSYADVQKAAIESLKLNNVPFDRKTSNALKRKKRPPK